MRHIVRSAALVAFTIATAACSGGPGGALPFVGPPNGSGGSPGTFQPGANSTALIRFIQGSPDYGAVDICIDDLPINITQPTVSYGSSSQLFAVAGGISHTVAVYPSLPDPALAGLECATAPGPYITNSPIAVTTISPGTAGNSGRESIVLGGTLAGGTRGIYVYGDPTFAGAPVADVSIAHNAAPRFSAALAMHTIGFGYVPVAGAPTNLPGAQGLVAPIASIATAASINGYVESSFPVVPASFYDGAGVLAGTVVPITTVAAPSPIAGQPYVIQLYA
ncbi:MAG: hypothetical protein M3R30_01560, partial [Candidatus Eremiobacteraeota bacterium]|nr:hypothetical protein [Candidatus Eremiobacteraeota bacterium]